MTNHIQLLKLYGQLPSVGIEDCAENPKPSVAMSVSEEAYASLVGRWCDHPDRYDPEVAAMSEGDKDKYFPSLSPERFKFFIKAHRRMGTRRPSKYRGERWPKGCVPSYPDNHVIKRFVDWERWPENQMRPVVDSDLDELVRATCWGTKEEIFDRWLSKPLARVARWFADEAWRRVGADHMSADADGPQGHHHIHIIPKAISGPTIGLGWYPDGLCTDHVEQHIDVINFSLSFLARLFLHEDGHCHGEEHQFAGQDAHRGVMGYKAPPGGLFYGWCPGGKNYPIPRDPSLDNLILKYGGNYFAIDENKTETPPPSPPVDDGGTIFVAEFKDGGTTYEIHRRKKNPFGPPSSNPIVWS